MSSDFMEKDRKKSSGVGVSIRRCAFEGAFDAGGERRVVLKRHWSTVIYGHLVLGEEFLESCQELFAKTGKFEFHII